MQKVSNLFFERCIAKGVEEDPDDKEWSLGNNYEDDL